MMESSYIAHHGLLLKNYITQNDINKKGGLNNLADALGITRQGIYVLYDQKEIKEKHRNAIIEHLDLPKNFFPDIPSVELKHNTYVMELQQKLIQTQNELIEAERKVSQLSYSPKVLPVVIDGDNKDQIALIPRKAVAGYTKNFMDVEYMSKLQTFSLPDSRGGFAFEIEGDSMTPSNIHHKDYVICEELIERTEEVNETKPHILVLSNGDIVCKLVKVNAASVSLISTNKDYKSYNVKLKSIKQIWKVKGKYTPNL